MIKQMVELIQQIDISKYTQAEFVAIVDDIYKECKDIALDALINDMLNRNGWQDTGGSG